MFRVLGSVCCILVLWMSSNQIEVNAASNTGEIRFPRMVQGDPRRSFASPFKEDTASLSPVENFHFIGHAAKHKRDGKDAVMLTPAMAGRQGAIVNAYRASTEAGFDVAFDIEIVKGAGSPTTADGIAFWLLDDLPEPGPVYGIQNKFSGLGIIIDTYSNSQRHQHPYVYAWRNDGTVRWDDSVDGHGVELAPGCEINKVRLDTPTRIFIQLFHGKLKVAYSVGHFYAWQVCFEIENVDVPFKEGVFALSASTGTFFAAHYVTRLQLSVFGESLKENPKKIDRREFHVKTSRGEDSDEYEALQEPTVADEQLLKDAEASENKFYDEMAELESKMEQDVDSIAAALGDDARKEIMILRSSLSKVLSKVLENRVGLGNARVAARKFNNLYEELGALNDELTDEYEAVHRKLKNVVDTLQYVGQVHTQMVELSKSLGTGAEEAHAMRGHGSFFLIIMFVMTQIVCAVLVLYARATNGGKRKTGFLV